MMTAIHDVDPAEAGPGLPYRCTACSWHGRGGGAAYDHHRETGHDVLLPNGVRAVFACCKEALNVV